MQQQNEIIRAVQMIRIIEDVHSLKIIHKMIALGNDTIEIDELCWSWIIVVEHSKDPGDTSNVRKRFVLKEPTSQKSVGIVF